MYRVKFHSKLSIMSAPNNDNWLAVINDVYHIVENKDIGFIRTLTNTLDVRVLHQVDLRISNKGMKNKRHK